ncbi:MAG TPA: cobalamin-dependent protein [Candidatus Nanopelagicaceae bacterium]|nr:cobalamin-dependent protein [Candidatus Nanopelagicaceae bacterium]
MTAKESLEKLKDAIIKGDSQKAILLVKESNEMGIPVKDILNRAILKGAEEAGKLYEEGEYFLPDLLMTGDAINAATEILKSSFDRKSEIESKGTILIGTVEGDIHDLGKSLVVSLLNGQGFNVVDLGSDVPPEEFLRKAKEINPKLIGLSGLMTMSISKMIETVNLLKSENIQSRIIIGGGILSKESCEMIGADDFAKDGWEGVKKINKLI